MTCLHLLPSLRSKHGPHGHSRSPSEREEVQSKSAEEIVQRKTTLTLTLDLSAFAWRGGGQTR